MTQYIDKSAIVAEIDRRIKERDFQMKRGCWVSSTYMYEDLLDFIDILEVKEVGLEKAEQFIQDCTRKCSNELCSIQDKYGKQIISYHEWLTPNDARRTAEIAKEETIDKACEWLLKNDSYAKPTEVLVRDFRKAMEE